MSQIFCAVLVWYEHFLLYIVCLHISYIICDGALYSFPSDGAEDIEEGPVRNLSVVREMIMKSDLPAVVKERSVQVFTELGEAEAKTHGSTLDQVDLLFALSSDAKLAPVGVCGALLHIGVLGRIPL